LLDHHYAGKTLPTGYLLPEAAEFCWGDVSKALGKELVKMGLAKTDTVNSCSNEEEMEKAFGKFWGRAAFAIGSNSRSRGPICRSLGWKCVEGDAISTLHDEIEVIHKGLQDGSYKPILSF